MSALHIATLALVAILVVAAIGKLRADDAAVFAEWRDLGVPELLNRTWLRRAHPFGEFSLALASVLPRPLSAIGALGMFVLSLVYLVIVTAAWRRRDRVHCSCFGSARRVPITSRTVVRNALLVLLAACAILAAVGQRASLYGLVVQPRGASIAADGPLAAVMVLLVLATGWFSAVAPADPDLLMRPEEGTGAEKGTAAEPDKNLRTPIPSANVVESDGSRTDLNALIGQHALLLLFVTRTCGPCRRVVADLEAIRERVPQIDVRVVSAISPDQLESVPEAWRRGALYDERGEAEAVLQVRGKPAAVLLGPGGMLAGGPVLGPTAIGALVDDIVQTLPAPAAEDAEQL